MLDTADLVKDDQDVDAGIEGCIEASFVNGKPKMVFDLFQAGYLSFSELKWEQVGWGGFSGLIGIIT